MKRNNYLIVTAFLNTHKHNLFIYVYKHAMFITACKPKGCLPDRLEVSIDTVAIVKFRN